VRVFRPDVPDFVLTVVDGVDAEIPLDGPAIVLCVRGAVAIAGGPELERGHAAYVADEPVLRLSGEGLAFVASEA
jgi:mannose-6-phosphate isomerase